MKKGLVEFREIGSRETGVQSPTAFERAYKAEITSIHRLTESESLYRMQIMNADERRGFDFVPGQFVMLELPGIGEAPFSITSSPLRHGDIELCIRRTGNLTNFLSRTSRGTRVGLRGPLGNGFPMERMRGQDILLIAGGLGLAPLRACISYVQDNRSRFNRADIIYGTREPSQILFSYQHDWWRADDIGLQVIVERSGPGWAGPVGKITDVLGDVIASRGDSLADGTYAIVCGPPVMFKFVCDMLTARNLPMQKMFVSLERRMHCGMGKCCRCNVGSTYTCLKGPVFDYWTVMNLKEAI